MSRSSFSNEQILNQLDASAESGQFPMLDNGYLYLADARLSAYGDRGCWAVLIEILGTDVRFGEHDSIENRVYGFGNCLNRLPGTTNYLILHPTADGPDEVTFTDDDIWKVRPDARTIRIRNLVIPINPDPIALAARGIDLITPPAIMAADLLRSLVPEHRSLLLATEEELQQVVPSDLPLLIRLDAWRHPDLAGGEKPSDSSTFQMLADVLVTGDPACYQSNEFPNTHWSNWPEGGRL